MLLSEITKLDFNEVKQELSGNPINIEDNKSRINNLLNWFIELTDKNNQHENKMLVMELKEAVENATTSEELTSSYLNWLDTNKDEIVKQQIMLKDSIETLTPKQIDTFNTLLYQFSA